MLRPLSTLWRITFTLQLQMTSAPVIQVTKDYGSISTSKIPIITRLSRMEDQQALTYPDLSSSAPLGNVTNIYGFISTSVRLITTTLGRMVDQYATILSSK